MSRQLKITDTSPIACKYKVARFREDSELAEFKDDSFCVNRWVKEKRDVGRQKRIGAVVSLVVFGLLMVGIFGMCVVVVN